MARPRTPLIIKDTHAEIHFKNGQKALIDLEDVALVSKYGWVLDDTKPNWYVHTSTGEDRKTLRLHRLIMNPPPGKSIDHIDGNGLNNKRENLRICDQKNNARNRRKLTTKTSIFKGVHRRENGKWRATIRVDGKLLNIGTFENELSAAKAYNEFARKYFGEFACLNQFVS